MSQKKADLLLAGIDIKTVQYLAGHSSVQITLNIYTHLMANRPEDTAGAVLAAFGAGGQASGAGSETKSLWAV